MGVIKTNNEFTKNLETKKGENEVLHKEELDYKTKMYEK